MRVVLLAFALYLTVLLYSPAQAPAPALTPGAGGEGSALFVYDTQAVEYQLAHPGQAGVLPIGAPTGAMRAAQTLTACSDGKTVVTYYQSALAVLPASDIVAVALPMHGQAETIGVTSGTQLMAVAGNSLTLPCAVPTGLAAIVTRTAP